MDSNEVYYIPMRYGIPNAPLVSWDNDYNYFVDQEPVKLVEPLSLCLADPEPNSPVMADYLRLLSDSMVTNKIQEVIESMEIGGVQLLPGRVKVNIGEYYEYWLVYIYHRIEGCLDLEKSDFSGDPNDINFMDKIILNNNAIEQIPIEKRLIFKIKEYPHREIYHQSVVDKIMETSPTGLKFWPLTDWHPLAYN